MDAAHSDYFATLVEHETSLWNALDRYLRTVPGSVTLGRFGVLRVIDSGEGRARVQDVAAEMGITVGAASRLVDRLESDGLASRSPNPTDRRGSVLELTTAG
ncbi:MAG: MarR family transcriptional regulator, partial [Leucobacter sp.]